MQDCSANYITKPVTFTFKLPYTQDIITIFVLFNIFQDVNFRRSLSETTERSGYAGRNTSGRWCSISPIALRIPPSYLASGRKNCNRARQPQPSSASCLTLNLRDSARTSCYAFPASPFLHLLLRSNALALGVSQSTPGRLQP
jgi:hypothetical protein